MNKNSKTLTGSGLGTDKNPAPSEAAKQTWVKPELQKIDTGSDTQAGKPSTATFESSPGWGVS